MPGKGWEDMNQPEKLELLYRWCERMTVGLGKAEARLGAVEAELRKAGKRHAEGTS